MVLLLVAIQVALVNGEEAEEGEDHTPKTVEVVLPVVVRCTELAAVAEVVLTTAQTQITTSLAPQVGKVVPLLSAAVVVAVRRVVAVPERPAAMAPMVPMVLAALVVAVAEQEQTEAQEAFLVAVAVAAVVRKVEHRAQVETEEMEW